MSDVNGAGRSAGRPAPTRLERQLGGVRIEQVTRRRFLGTLAGAGAAVLTGCQGGSGEGSSSGRTEAAASGAGGARPWVKSPEPFIQHPTNLEARLELLDGYLTPNDLFFVRNHTPTPRVDPASYRLRVEGDAVGRPLDLGLDEIRGLPARSVVSYLECAGNWRSFFEQTHGRRASGSQWGTGAVGCASWSGTSLAEVLRLAELTPDAVAVDLIGLDGGGFSRPLPIARALQPDTLLAYVMNGEPLPPDHGFPLRAVVPGWVASSGVKWLGRIVVSTEPIWAKNNTTSYVLVGEQWPPDEYSPAQGGPITVQSIKAALALPRPARLSAGRHRLRGFAHSPHGPIAAVHWSDDGGASWHAARIVGPVIDHGWSRFEFEWDATPGDHALLVRATDGAGNTQPDAVPFNEKGYLLNVPVPHAVQVAEGG